MPYYRAIIKMENEFLIKADTEKEAMQDASWQANNMDHSQFIKEASEEIELIEITDKEEIAYAKKMLGE